MGRNQELDENVVKFTRGFFHVPCQPFPRPAFSFAVLVYAILFNPYVIHILVCDIYIYYIYIYFFLFTDIQIYSHIWTLDSYVCFGASFA